MGGVWELQIRSILMTLTREHRKMLDDESLRTLVEVECTINSRPLTFPSSDPDDLSPLTPNHILTMKAKAQTVETRPISSKFVLVTLEKGIYS